MLEDPRKAYIVLGAEPEFDCANPVAARAALDQADFVVALSPFRHGMEWADVLLPIAPFTETAGTFVSCEGRVQSFTGVAPPHAETRPAWKVLRVLGSLLGLPGFDYDSIDAVRAALLPSQADVTARLRNDSRVAVAAPAAAAQGLERIADVPIYFADPLVRRAPSLQRTSDAKPPRARMAAATMQRLGIADGAMVKVRQGRGEAVLAASRRRDGSRERGADRRGASVDLRARRPVRPRPGRGVLMDAALAPVAQFFGSGWAVVVTLAQIVVMVVVLILCVAYLTLAERKVIGWMQVRIGPNRVGPLGLLQPFADVAKLLFKEIILPAGANRYLFYLAPLLAIGSAMAAWAVVPLPATW